MARRGSIVRGLLGTLLGAVGLGCSRQPPPPVAIDAAALPRAFPMIVVWPDLSIVLWRDEAAYARLHSNILNDASRPAPVLIDGAGRLYDLAGVTSTKSGAWHMLNPVATSPVTFKATPRAGDFATARSLVRGVRYLPYSSDDAIRARIDAATDVAGIVRAIDAELSTPPPDR